MVQMVVIVIVVLVAYLFYDSTLFRELKKKFSHKVETQNQKRTRVATPATLYIKEASGKYKPFTIEFDKVVIGRTDSADIALYDNSVEKKCHAIISMKYRDGDIAYFIQNKSKINPLTLLDIEKERYTSLDYGETIELSDDDYFYVGRIKMHFVIPQPDISYTIDINSYNASQTSNSAVKHNDREVVGEEELVFHSIDDTGKDEKTPGRTKVLNNIHNRETKRIDGVKRDNRKQSLVSGWMINLAQEMLDNNSEQSFATVDNENVRVANPDMVTYRDAEPSDNDWISTINL